MSETIIERLSRVRKEKGLTLFELAIRMRVPTAMMSQLERGKRHPTAQQADVIRAFLGGKL